MKCFITGIKGFIGSNLAKALLKEGFEVRGFDLEKTSEMNLATIKDQIEMFYGDVTNPESLQAILQDVDVIFHLAALLLDWGPENLIMKVNYEGTKNVLSAAINANVKRFIAMSSLTVHGFKGFQKADETTSYAPYNAYARSKKAVEDLLNETYQNGHIETVIVRPGFTIFGPNDRLFSFEAYNRITRGKSFPLVNHGKSLMCYSYVDNLVDGLKLVATHSKAAGQTYIISDGPILPFKHFLEQLFTPCSVPVNFSNFPSWLALPVAGLLSGIYKLGRSKKGPLITPYRVKVSSTDLGFTNAKIVKDLGYHASINLEEAAKRTFTWFENEAVKN
ncbi:MAG: NAD-dependent epimerase/dehydratase family protein [Candidatus Helarchaeota archaeon]